MFSFKKAASAVFVLGMCASLAACGKVGSSEISGIDDLVGKSIGVQLGTTGDIFSSDYAEENEGTTVERYNKGADAIQALVSGKIDCVIIDENPANAFVEKNDTLAILDEPFAEEEYAICVSKDNSALTEEINSALAELKEEGTVDSIISNYIGDDTQGQNPYISPEDTDTSKGTLVMATNAQFEPYESYDENKNIVGIDPDMAKAICDKLGYALEISDMEFDSIISAVQSGKADFGMAGMTVTDERKENVDFTDTYTKTKQVIVVRK